LNSNKKVLYRNKGTKPNFLASWIAPSIIIFLVLLILEGVNFAFWELWGSPRVPYHERVDLAATLASPEFRTWKDDLTMPDRDLGWTSNPTHPNVSDDGAREAEGQRPGTRVYAYGDSFVFGAEVGNDQAFTYLLSQTIGTGVRNFGVGGYGPDQAILRLERHLKEGQRPEWVILGMASESLARVVNIFRKLYIPAEIAHFVKPMFVASGGAWRIVNAVPDWPPTGVAVQTLVEATKLNDLWYVQNEKRPRFDFPYMVATFEAVKFFAFDVLRWQDLYKDERTVATMTYVLERFVHLSKNYGFRPVFVVFPNPEDLLRLQAKEPAYFEEFLEHVTQRFKDDMLIVRVLDKDIDLARFHIRPFGGHPSPYGQRVIANAIAESLAPYFKK